jgi:ADP-ribose pyrophosphatase YjhB (NUDIX family)
MPAAVSKKQYRMMRAIAEGAKVDHPRGAPPKSIAQKYVDSTSSTKDLPEQHGENRGGHWTDKHHEEHHKKEKKSKKKLKKSFEALYKGRATAVIVVDEQGRLLLGKHMGKNILANPGGHLESGENEEVGALRELHEETGLIGRNPQKIYQFKSNGNDTSVFMVEAYTGTPKSSEELKSLKWYDPQDIAWDKVRDCCVEPLKYFIESKLGKSLKGMVALENLSKNIIRQRGDAVFEISHGEALKLVGTGLFKKLKNEVKDMVDESFKEFSIDTYTVNIRKHMNDVYSGRVIDGHKQVYQFTNKSLPELTAGLMSVFEWYLPEDEKVFDMVDDLSDDVVQGGLQHLMDNYRRHNIGNIYDEVEDIRSNLRNGMAVDLQQVESRMMSLFDKLEQLVHELVGKHNKLTESAGEDVDQLEAKLRALQTKLDELAKKPETVEAFSTNPGNPSRLHREEYPYLAKPVVEIEPSGKIKISFGADWSSLEKENFLKDMRAKVIKKAAK